MRSQTPNVNDVVRRGDGPAIDYMFAVKQEIHDGDVAELTGAAAASRAGNNDAASSPYTGRTTITSSDAQRRKPSSK
jgi:hypothetical protein